MINLLECLTKELGEAITEVKVKSVRVGLVYTGVVLSTGDAGVAYTPMHELLDCPELVAAGEIAGKPASEVMEKAESRNFVEVAIGVATINALSQMVFEAKPEKYVYSDVDVLDLIWPEDKVVMVGYFKPLIHKILRKTRDLCVVEKRTIKDDRVSIMPSREAASILPSADVILITGSTLTNKTVNQILKLRGDARETILLGPTASMVPQPWFKKGVTAVMGIKIIDAEMMLRVVSEAGGTRQLLSTCARKTAFVRNKKLVRPSDV